jgi:O-acetyl-ADP-ribose deacetylase (regulator of RNase III)
MKFICRGVEVRIIQGDITEFKVDAIVNAANPSLLGGGGVDGAIHRKGGSKILEECKVIRRTMYPNGLPTGKAVITTGGNLPTKYVIHTVGPIWRGGNHGEEMLLSETYKNSLEIAITNDLNTIAFPSISTGAYGFPKDIAAKIALTTVKKFLEIKDSFEEIIHVSYTTEDFRIYQKKGLKIFQLGTKSTSNTSF